MVDGCAASASFADDTIVPELIEESRPSDGRALSGDPRHVTLQPRLNPAFIVTSRQLCLGGRDLAGVRWRWR
jgi:hypothetical protein